MASVSRQLRRRKRFRSLILDTWFKKRLEDPRIRPFPVFKQSPAYQPLPALTRIPQLLQQGLNHQNMGDEVDLCQRRIRRTVRGCGSGTREPVWLESRFRLLEFTLRCGRSLVHSGTVQHRLIPHSLESRTYRVTANLQFAARRWPRNRSICT